jgi:Uma2 family endonuclease
MTPITQISGQTSGFRERGYSEAAALIDLATCINFYRFFTPGWVCVHTPVQLTPERRMYPDIVVVMDSMKTGRCRAAPDGFFTGSPDFIADIFPEDSLLDYAERREIYAGAGVTEYVAWQCGAPFLWNCLVEGKYEEVSPDDDGLIESQALPGLWIPVRGPWAKDWNLTLACIANGVASKEHHRFVARFWG